MLQLKAGRGDSERGGSGRGGEGGQGVRTRDVGAFFACACCRSTDDACAILMLMCACSLLTVPVVAAFVDGAVCVLLYRAGRQNRAVDTAADRRRAGCQGVAVPATAADCTRGC